MSLDETLKTNILNTTKKIKNYIDNLINSHTHGNISNDGKVGSTSGKPLITTTNGAITTGSFGSSSGTFCQGNDSRLSDPRTPTIHTHSKSEITDFPTIPSASSSTPYADVSGGAMGSSSNYAKADHQHPLSSAYSASGHTHIYSHIDGVDLLVVSITYTDGTTETLGLLSHSEYEDPL